MVLNLNQANKKSKKKITFYLECDLRNISEIQLKT